MLDITGPAMLFRQSIYQLIEVTEGESATFFCTARGIPPPTINWPTANISTKHIIKLHTQETNSYYYTFSNFTLLNVTRSSYREYSCSASNYIGKDIHTFNLSVNSKFKTELNTFISHLQEVTLYYFLFMSSCVV